MDDAVQFLVLAGVGGLMGWVSWQAVTTGVFRWRLSHWDRRQNPIVFWLMTAITTGICLVAIRVLIFGLFEAE